MIAQLSLPLDPLPATVSAFTAPAARRARAQLAKLCQYCGSGTAAPGECCSTCKVDRRRRHDSKMRDAHPRKPHQPRQGSVVLDRWPRL